MPQEAPMSDKTLDALGTVQKRVADAPELRATYNTDENGKQVYKALAYDITEPDRHGTTMTPGSLEADIERGIPLMLWHDRESFPVGKVIDWQHTERGPVARFVFADYDKAHLARTLVDTGFLTAVSVGFIPKEGYVRDGDDVVVFTRSELVELSLTATPSSRGALIDLKRSIDDLAGSSSELSDEAPPADDVEPANPESELTTDFGEDAAEPDLGPVKRDVELERELDEMSRWQRTQRLHRLRVTGE
jgi:HK97 family phage prohead protease